MGHRGSLGSPILVRHSRVHSTNCRKPSIFLISRSVVCFANNRCTYLFLKFMHIIEPFHWSNHALPCTSAFQPTAPKCNSLCTFCAETPWNRQNAPWYINNVLLLCVVSDLYNFLVYILMFVENATEQGQTAVVGKWGVVTCNIIWDYLTPVPSHSIGMMYLLCAYFFFRRR